MKKLAHILKLTQEELKIEIYNYLRQKKMEPLFEDGFVYAKGNIPILLVAHMDTVSDKPPKRIFYNKKKDKIFNPDGGLGGDDRCGVYAIIRLLEKYSPHILFTEDEEIGCVGAILAAKKLPKPKVKYIIEFDRRGNNDCIFYECSNYNFINYIESFGFETDYGTCSDISVLGKKWDIAAVNLSCGYYNEHTKEEYIVFGQLQDSINRVASILKDHKKSPYFDYQEINYTPRHFDQNSKDCHNEDLLRGIDQYYRNRNNYQQQEKKSKKKLILKKENKQDTKNEV